MMIITFDKTYDHLDWNSVDLDLFFSTKRIWIQIETMDKGLPTISKLLSLHK